MSRNHKGEELNQPTRFSKPQIKKLKDELDNQIDYYKTEFGMTTNCWAPTDNGDGVTVNDTADFFAESWSGWSLSKEEAEKMCEGCPVLEMCRDYAIAAKEPLGIWGGTRPIDRGRKNVLK